MPLHPCGCREGRNLRERKALLVERRFFCASLAEALGDKEAISGDAQSGVVMKSLPTSSLVMREAELLLEFLIVALDSPTHLGDEDQLFDRGVGRCGGRTRTMAKREDSSALLPSRQETVRQASCGNAMLCKPIVSSSQFRMHLFSQPFISSALQD
jgi:hypothetical protein